MAKNTPQRLVFSKTRVEALPVPKTGRVWWHDTACPGLAVWCSSTGGRVFYFNKKLDGRSLRVRIGSFPGVTVEAARNVARAHAVIVATGGDPQAAKRARRQEATFGDLWEHWQAHASTRKKATSNHEDERLYNAHLKSWAGRKLSSIKRRDVAELHDGMADRPYQANRLLALLKSMLNKAGDLDYKGENPARGIEPYPEVARDRFLLPEELPRFFAALAEEPNLFLQGFFWLALLSGARRRNLEAMRWADVSWELRQWRIPDTKGNVPVVVPLSPPALEVLRQLREHEKAHPEWVFVGRKNHHITDPMPAWRRLLKRAGIEDLHIHDLRRSLGSYMAILGSSLPTIGKALGHVRQETTAIYSRLTIDPVRASVDAAAAKMLEYLPKKEVTP
jgi:integrase